MLFFANWSLPSLVITGHWWRFWPFFRDEYPHCFLKSLLSSQKNAPENVIPKNTHHFDLFLFLLLELSSLTSSLPIRSTLPLHLLPLLNLPSTSSHLSSTLTSSLPAFPNPFLPCCLPPLHLVLLQRCLLPLCLVPLLNGILSFFLLIHFLSPLQRFDLLFDLLLARWGFCSMGFRGLGEFLFSKCWSMAADLIGEAREWIGLNQTGDRVMDLHPPRFWIWEWGLDGILLMEVTRIWKQMKAMQEK